MTQILRNLPDDLYQFAISDNSPSTFNLFLTLSDVLGLINTYRLYHSKTFFTNQTSLAATPT